MLLSLSGQRRFRCKNMQNLQGERESDADVPDGSWHVPAGSKEL